MSLTIEWNDKGLKKIFEALSPDQQADFHKKALRSTATKVARISKQAASNAGYGRQGETTKNGWVWTRYGRVLSSISVSKTWKKAKSIGVKVYNKAGARGSFRGSAPHAHLAILGHRKFYPRPNGSTVQDGFIKGVPFYQSAYNQADVIFEREIEASVGRMVRRLNKAGKL
jgi:hypothetical protein